MADSGGATLDRLGTALNLTKERVRQLIVSALLKVKASPELLDRPDGSKPPRPERRRKGGPGPRPSDGIGLEERCSQVLELLQKSGPMLGAEVQRKLGTIPSRHFRIIEVLRQRGLIVKLDYYTLALPGQSFDFGVRPISKRVADSIATGKDRILPALARFPSAATSTLAAEAGMSYARALRVLEAMQSEGTVRKDKDGRWARV